MQLAARVTRDASVQVAMADGVLHMQRRTRTARSHPTYLLTHQSIQSGRTHRARLIIDPTLRHNGAQLDQPGPGRPWPSA
jgi:hypothetical protein